MTFDIKKLQAKTAGTPVTPPPTTLEAQLVASVAAVAINRPRTEPPLTVTTIEGPVAAFGLLEYPADPTTDGVAPEEAPPAPKARRGRPRKVRAESVECSESSPPVTSTTTSQTETGGTDPKARTVQTAPGCAPSAGDRHAAVCATLRDARQSISEALAVLGGES